MYGVNGRLDFCTAVQNLSSHYVKLLFCSDLLKTGMRLITRKSASVFGVVFLTVVLTGQSNTGQDSSTQGSSSQTKANPVVGGPAIQEPAAIIQFLSRTISWHHQLTVEQKLANQPSDLSFLQENRRNADQVVRLAFDYARSQAQLQARQRASQPSQPSSNDSSAQTQRMEQALQNLDQEIEQTQGEIQGFREKLSTASPAKRNALQSQIAETQSEVSLFQARRDAIESMIEFVNSSTSGGGGAGLRAQIEELAGTVPVQLSRAPASNQNQTNQSQASQNQTNQNQEETPSQPASSNVASEPIGIWALAADLIRLSGKLHTLKNELSASESLQQDAIKLRAPLLDYLRNLVRQGDQLASAADTSGPAALAQQKQQLDALTTQFKQTTSGLLPLSKINVLLGIQETTIKNWRESIRDQLHDELRQLLLRLGVLAILIAAVFGVGEFWRRATYRYVHDGRRRYQFLLLRRVAIWTAIILIIVLTFATQLGSAVTFAGLLTAGIAVALQNVIVSVVGYFFLIGKYGLRVGDRVQIAGVTGEVVEIGLVRIHLMELGGAGESQPTGRVVAFSNSIVFQPTAGLFKQIPGTNFVWHEVKLVLAADTDYHLARERITQAVDSVLATYQENMETQRVLMERNLSSVSGADLKSKVRLYYTASGIEVTVRFPVELGKAAEMDDHLMRELLAAADREPKLKLVSAEMPVAKAGV